MNTNHEELFEGLVERAQAEGIWIDSPVYQAAVEALGEDEADKLLREYGCPDDICDGTGWVEDMAVTILPSGEPSGPSGKKSRCPCNRAHDEA